MALNSQIQLSRKELYPTENKVFNFEALADHIEKPNPKINGERGWKNSAM